MERVGFFGEVLTAGAPGEILVRDADDCRWWVSATDRAEVRTWPFVRNPEGRPDAVFFPGDLVAIETTADRIVGDRVEATSLELMGSDPL